jgi:hypothetical protein
VGPRRNEPDILRARPASAVPEAWGGDAGGAHEHSKPAAGTHWGREAAVFYRGSHAGSAGRRAVSTPRAMCLAPLSQVL